MSSNQESIEFRSTQQELQALQDELLTDRLTGLPNERAYEEAVRRPVQGFVEVDGLKSFLGSTIDDKLTQAVAQILDEEGVEAYRIAGNYFYVQSDDERTLRSQLDAVMERAEASTFHFITRHRVCRSFRGLGVSYGIGKTLEEAEEAMHTSCREREALQLRAPPRTPDGVGESLLVDWVKKEKEAGRFEGASNFQFVLAPCRSRYTKVYSLPPRAVQHPKNLFDQLMEVLWTVEAEDRGRLEAACCALGLGDLDDVLDALMTSDPWAVVARFHRINPWHDLRALEKGDYYEIALDVLRVCLHEPPEIGIDESCLSVRVEQLRQALREISREARDPAVAAKAREALDWDDWLDILEQEAREDERLRSGEEERQG